MMIKRRTGRVTSYYLSSSYQLLSIHASKVKFMHYTIAYRYRMSELIVNERPAKPPSHFCGPNIMSPLELMNPGGSEVNLVP